MCFVFHLKNTFHGEKQYEREIHIPSPHPPDTSASLPECCLSQPEEQK